MEIKKCLAILSFVLVMQQLSAQGEFGIIDIDRIYRPDFQDAVKLNPPIQKYPITVGAFTFDYSISPTLFPLQPTYREAIPPLTLAEAKEADIPRTYLVAGAGNYRNTVLDFYTGSKKSTRNVYGLAIKHRSGVAPSQFSNFIQTNVDFSGKRIYQRHILNANISGNFNRIHRYGNYAYSLPDTFNYKVLDSIRSNYLSAKAHVAYGNFKNKNVPLKFQTEFDFNYLNDRKTQREIAGIFLANIQKDFGESKFASFATSYDYNDYQSEPGSLLRSIIRVNAAYNIKMKGFKLLAGFKSAFESSTPSDPTQASESIPHLYPDLKIEGDLIKKYVRFFATLSGDLKKNSMQSIVQINPFVNNSLKLKNTNESISFQGGIKGSLSDQLAFNASFNYKALNNYLLFLNENSNKHYFVPVYSGNNSTMFNVHGEILYRKHQQWFVSFMSDYYHYELVNAKNWQLPTLTSNLTLKYNFQDKIIPYFNVTAFNSRLGNTIDRQNEVSLKGAFDISVGTDYQLTNKVDVFIKLNNVLNKKYQIWNQYNVQGFHALLGLKLNIK